VALTRARSTLLTTAAHWYAGTERPQGPSEFYRWVVDQNDLVTVLPEAPPPLIDPRLRDEGTRVAGTDPSAQWSATPPPPPPAARGRSATKRGGKSSSVSSDAQGLLLDLVPEVVDQGKVAVRSIPVSALVSFARCPRQYDALYVQGFPRRSSAAARLGTAVHRWIEQRSAPQQQLWSMDPEPLAIPPEAAAPHIVEATSSEADQFDPDVDPNVDLDMDVDAEPVATDPGSTLAEIGDGLRRSFLASKYADLIPHRIEDAIDLPIGSLRLRGRIDAVYGNSTAAPIEIVDFKTGREPDSGDPSASVQIDAYGLAAVDLWGHHPDHITTSYVYLRVDAPAKVVATQWDAQRTADVRKHFASLAIGVQEGRRAPHPGAWCSRCEIRPLCPEGRLTVE
jgi:DNA helicase II / ATP-dependent DNA helicase PcrA